MPQPNQNKRLLTGIAWGTAVLCALFLCLTSLGRRTAGAVLSPFVSTWNWCANGFANGVRLLQPGKLSRADEARELRRRLDELETLVAGTSDLRLENAELRKQAALPPRTGWRAVLAEVISRDPVRWNERLLLNRGFEDGLVTGAVVLVDGKVFGRILSCNRHSAVVVSVLSQDCRFGVAVSGSNAVGVLVGGGENPFGDGQNGFLVDFLPKNLTVSPDQMVVTSGLGGWMPAGLPVGWILADAPDGGRVHFPDEARALLHAVPAAPFGAFHFVSVLVPENTTPPESAPQ